jgi:hypothetical protein
MAGPDRDDLQARRDIRRAYALLGRLRGLNAEDSMAVLHDHAALTGVSLHAAALGVLTEWHPSRGPRRRVPAAQGYRTTDNTGRIILRWQGRKKAYLWVSGPGGVDLAARLRRAVERATRAGAIHLVIDTRATTDVGLELGEVLTWTGRRLDARQGTLTLRTPTPERQHPSSR